MLSFSCRLVILLLCFASSITANSGKCLPGLPSNIWLDFVVLMDTSSSLDSNRYIYMMKKMQLALRDITIGQALKYQSRVSIISYSASANVLADLDYFNNTDQFLNFNIPYMGDETADLTGAVDAATDEFYQFKQLNRRQVLIIASGGYREGSTDPQGALDTFKMTNGIVVVFSFDSATDSKLMSFASDGYYFDASGGFDVATYLARLQKANCFCPCISECKSYDEQSLSPRQDPDNGCYIQSSLQSLRVLAQEYCNSTKSSRLPVLHTEEDLTNFGVVPFSNGLLQSGIWLGLQKISNAWMWDDGTPVEHFILDKLTGNESCAVVQKVQNSLSIVSVDCLSANYFACDLSTCNVANYCAPK